MSSSAIFPALSGLAWDVRRSPIWKNKITENRSGKEVRLGFWSYPRYEWEMTYNFLRSDSVNAEFQSLLGFFNARNASFDSFRYLDSDDNAVVGQTIGIGNGTQTKWQLVRSFGGYIEPILAPGTPTAVKLDGVTQSGATYSVEAWGVGTAPGVITFNTPPAIGKVITADFPFWWPVRFVDDTLDFKKFLSTVYSGDSVKLISLK